MEIFYSPDREGNTLLLSPEESAHCVRVLRHRAGESIDVIDGLGTLYHCRLLEASDKAARATIESEEPHFGSHPYRLTLAVCPTKNMDRYEWMAEKATEIGVDTIIPAIGERSERKTVKTDRLKRLVLSATKQSLKGAIPQVSESLSVKEVIKSAPEGALKLICYCFDGEKYSIPQLLCTPAEGQEIHILIGPEGDFSPAEAALAKENGWLPVSLGSSRLRTETAAIVAATQVYSAF